MPSISIPAAIAGVASAGISAVGASSAAKTQANAAKSAAQVQQNEFNQVTANEAPYLAGGGKGENELLNLLGLGTQGQAGITSALQATPGYQWQFGQGEQAILDSASATGGVGGGNTLKALTSFGQGLASTDYQQILNNYVNLAGSGQNAAANLGSLGVQTGANIGNSLTQAGNASAAGQVGVANALSGGINSLSSNYLLSSLLSQGGGFGGGLASGPSYLTS